MCTVFRPVTYISKVQEKCVLSLSHSVFTQRQKDSAIRNTTNKEQLHYITQILCPN